MGAPGAYDYWLPQLQRPLPQCRPDSMENTVRLSAGGIILRHRSGAGCPWHGRCGRHHHLVGQASPHGAKQRFLAVDAGYRHRFHHPCIPPPLEQGAATALRPVPLATPDSAGPPSEPHHWLSGLLAEQKGLARYRGCGLGSGSAGYGHARLARGVYCYRRGQQGARSSVRVLHRLRRHHQPQ